MTPIIKNNKEHLILIVDDDKALRQVLSMTLSREGFQVATAADGAEAVEKFEELNPDAILLDVIMPKVDGYTACGNIRNLPGGEIIPIIMITGQDDYDSINRAFDVGATDFVVKPLNPLLLSYRLRYVIRASRAIDDLTINKMKLSVAQGMAHLSDWEFDVKNNIIEWNGNICQIFGKKINSFCGNLEAFYAIVHRDDTAKVKLEIGTALANKKDFHFQHRIICQDGTQKIIQQEGQILSDNQGTPLRILFTSQDITKKKKIEDEVRFLAFYDRLTQLPNRLLFKEHLAKALINAKRDQSFLAVINIDIDNFRIINNTFGRDTGDELLKVIAERLKLALRENDTSARINDYDLTARFGADEFGVILEGLAEQADAGIVARRIISAIADMMVVGEHEIFLHSRIGVSVFPDDGDSVELLMKNSEAALSCAKDLEKDTYQFFTDELNSQAFARFVMETSLRKAIERDEFVLLFQPQVDLECGLVKGVEALIRWQHPDMGIVSPMEFIPIAEDSGLIIPIGEWVVKTACKKCKEWADKNYAVRMSINLSAVQFQADNLISMIEKAINDSGADRSLLEFEITESMLMDDVEKSISQMEKIKKLGVRLSIDDFGTGYSSLNYLKKFPVDALKVDRSFVSDITTSEEDAMIVKAIVTLAKNLNMEVIAEGIELKEHLSFLNGLGCDFAQGYLISRPVPDEEIVKFFGVWSVDDIA